MWLRQRLVLFLFLPGLQACMGVAAREPVPWMLEPPGGAGYEVLHPSSDPQPRGLHACPSETMSCYPGCAVVGDTYACGQTLITITGSLAAAIEAIALHEGLSMEDFCEKYEVLCAKGGKKNIDNEYVREAKELPKGADPCEFLRGLQNAAAASGDTVEEQKIKQAQKALGCRPNANGF
ncbi:polymorphic toxin type 34 domain-containing protein [Vitiosangium sp. GDMCC 1.1324]|uniref:polymorphic toxin type 34 domain-containing protein n=1 Tax=Vitiosangium sp. (strain GDMCC 1.1324) TaxID=2138576 RepID=UPI000D3CC4B4|nr:polymorphic toxin type 34 domain-containing protein [Vitiosangium sp. GDMCC 1.1324]PTL79667.1 hypothetical protein DAT35_33230 [Vitiosangium sp. GDMCC 1.1324]